MSSIEIDYEKLADGLETGMGHTQTIYSSADKQHRLRITPCGLVSTAIHNYAKRNNFDSRLLMSHPDLEFDPSLKHCMTEIRTDQDSVTVDASFSQSLKYVGINSLYILDKNINPYPNEKIIGFKPNQREEYIEWL